MQYFKDQSDRIWYYDRNDKKIYDTGRLDTKNEYIINYMDIFYGWRSDFGSAIIEKSSVKIDKRNYDIDIDVDKYMIAHLGYKREEYNAYEDPDFYERTGYYPGELEPHEIMKFNRTTIKLTIQYFLRQNEHQLFVKEKIYKYELDEDEPKLINKTKSRSEKFYKCEQYVSYPGGYVDMNGKIFHAFNSKIIYDRIYPNISNSILELDGKYYINGTDMSDQLDKFDFGGRQVKSARKI